MVLLIDILLAIVKYPHKRQGGKQFGLVWRPRTFSSQIPVLAEVTKP